MAGVFMQVQAISIGLTVEDLALISAFVPFICTIGIVAVGKQNKNGVRAGHFQHVLAIISIWREKITLLTSDRYTSCCKHKLRKLKNKK